jgi:hypothetical protein
MASIRADYPMSPIDGLDGLYYFEIRIENCVHSE